jgi:putative endonuclease
VVRTSGFSARGGSALGGQSDKYMYYLYILQSLADLGYYIGISDNPTFRLKQHNLGKVKSTKNRMPFILKYKEGYQNKTEARKREIELKKNYQKRKVILKTLGFTVK